MARRPPVYGSEFPYRLYSWHLLVRRHSVSKPFDFYQQENSVTTELIAREKAKKKIMIIIFESGKERIINEVESFSEGMIWLHDNEPNRFVKNEWVLRRKLIDVANN